MMPNHLLVKFVKLHKRAEVPRARPGDAGLDLVAISRDYSDGIWTYGTGLALEIPDGYAGLLFPRSSISRTSLGLVNSIGLVDSSYRGEILLKFRELIAGHNSIYDVYTKVAQLLILPYPQISFAQAKELSTTERGMGGFGSTGE